MGKEWKRSVAEALLQALNIDKEFQATLNTRNERMMADARAFSKHIIRLEKDITGMQSKMEDKFENLAAMLVAPMPRVWDYATHDDTVEALSREGTLGAGIDAQGLVHLQRDMRTKVEEEVLAPMKAWIKAFDQAAALMKKLEVQRLVLDNRRRTVGDLDHQLSTLHEKSIRTTPAHGGPSQYEGSHYDPKAARMIEEKSRKKAHKEGKLNKSQAVFQELEHVVYNSLKTLIEDADQFKVYAHAALVEMNACFASACGLFENPAEEGTSLELSSTAREAMPAPVPRGGSRVFSALASKLTRNRSTTGAAMPPPLPRDHEEPVDQVERFDAAPVGKIAPPVHADPEAHVRRPTHAAAQAYMSPQSGTRRQPSSHTTGWGY